MAAKKGPGKHRSAETGRYVKPAYAKRNPGKTVRETDWSRRRVRRKK
jgi:hypothetical protein